MPNYDRSGPSGKGPRTGRGLGDCFPNLGESSNNSRPRLGLGRKRGR